MHYDTTVDCNLEAPVKGGGIQQLDRVQEHSDRVTHCHSGLNLKGDKMNYHLGTRDPIWAIFSKSGQNFSRSGPKKKIHDLAGPLPALLQNMWQVKPCTTCSGQHRLKRSKSGSTSVHFLQVVHSWHWILGWFH